nr:hypothetical protein BN993_02853 [Virgibacillus halodenitrificans]
MALVRTRSCSRLKLDLQSTPISRSATNATRCTFDLIFSISIADGLGLVAWHTALGRVPGFAIVNGKFILGVGRSLPVQECLSLLQRGLRALRIARP